MTSQVNQTPSRSRLILAIDLLTNDMFEGLAARSTDELVRIQRWAARADLRRMLRWQQEEFEHDFEF